MRHQPMARSAILQNQFNRHGCVEGGYNNDWGKKVGRERQKLCGRSLGRGKFFSSLVMAKVWGGGGQSLGGGKPLLCPSGHQFFLVHFHGENYPACAGVFVPPVFGHSVKGAFLINSHIADGKAVVPHFKISAFCNLSRLQSPTQGASSHAQWGGRDCCAHT